jgi:hypothetical protein
MFNPFTEVAEGDPPVADLVEQAKNGDRVALEKMVPRHQRGSTTSPSAYAHKPR